MHLHDIPRLYYLPERGRTMYDRQRNYLLGSFFVVCLTYMLAQ